MHVHATAFGLQQDADPSSVARIGALLRRVALDTDGVNEVYAGPNNHHLAGERDQAVLVLMDTPEALDPFRAHPAHVRAGALIRSVQQGGVGLDAGPLHPGAGATNVPADAVRVHATLFRPAAAEDETRLEEVATQLAQIAGDCASVVGTYAGPNRSRHLSAQTHAVLVAIDATVGLTEFDAHPLRAAVGAALTSLVTEPVGVDLGPASFIS